MITSAANSLVLASVIAASLDKITYLSLRNSSGEYYRKPLTNATQITDKKRTYTFFLAETDGNGSIVEIGLHGNGATGTLNSGTCYATQTLVLTKSIAQSLTIDWTVSLV